MGVNRSPYLFIVLFLLWVFEYVTLSALIANAIEALRSSQFDCSSNNNSPDALIAMDADLLLQVSTQQCLEKLNNQRARLTPPTVYSYEIVPLLPNSVAKLWTQQPQSSKRVAPHPDVANPSSIDALGSGGTRNAPTAKRIKFGCFEVKKKLKMILWAVGWCYS